MFGLTLTKICDGNGSPPVDFTLTQQTLLLMKENTPKLLAESVEAATIFRSLIQLIGPKAVTTLMRECKSFEEYRTKVHQLLQKQEANNA